MRRVERWLCEPGSDRRLAAIRIGLCSLLAVRLSRSIYLQLAGQPAPLFRPISFMRLLPSMPPRGVVLVVQVAGIAAAVLAAVGWRARLSLPVAWAAGVFLGGITTSVGKVVHNDVLLLLALAPLMLAPSADAWSVDAMRARPRAGPRWSARYGWAARAAAVVVAGGYLFTGLSKLVFSGTAWVLSDNLRWALYVSSDAQSAPNGISLFIADRPWLAHVLAAGTILLELTFPVVLWRPRAAWAFVLGSATLHASIWATLHLDYSAWAVTAAVVLIDWPRLIERTRALRARPQALRTAAPP